MPPQYDASTQQQILTLHQQGVSATDIAELLRRDRNTVAAWLKSAGCVLQHGHRPRRFTETEEAELARDYAAGATAYTLATSHGCGPTVIYASLKRQGANIRSTQKGSANGAWKGGRIKGPEGYMYLYLADDDPLVAMRSMNRYAREHRVVMARSLGRPLERREQVHHVNGDRADNRLENLQLRVNAHGSGVCQRCSDCGSQNIVSLPLP